MMVTPAGAVCRYGAGGGGVRWSGMAPDDRRAGWSAEVMQFCTGAPPGCQVVGIDMAGALLGVGFDEGIALCFTRR
jgi:hypothetical protein